MFLFRCSGPTKVSVRVRGFLFVSQHDTFFRRVVSTSPNPLAGGSPLVDCPRLPIQYIRSYPPYWMPFLHPPPEDAPCRGDREPLITVLHTYCLYTVHILLRTHNHEKRLGLDHTKSAPITHNTPCNTAQNT